MTKRSLRLDLMYLLTEFICDWNMRPGFGKRSDRSDLVKRFQRKLTRKYTVRRKK